MKRSPLKRRTPLRARRKPASVIQADIWRDGLGPCVMRGISACDGRVDAHHVIRAAKLRQIGREDLLLSHANRLALCRRHHDEHHSRKRPVTRDLIPAAAWDFAAGLGLTWVLDRDYILTTSEAA